MEVHELYMTFRKELTAYAVSMAKNQDTADDLVQETFLRAMTHLDELQDLGQKQCRSWLYKTARNLYIDQVRRLSREVPQTGELLEQAPFEEDLSRGMVAQLVGRLDAMEADCDALYLVGGTLLQGRANVRLSRGMLEHAEDGLSLVSCGSVTVEEDVPAGLLREKLISIIGCGRVICTEEQQGILELAAQDTGELGPGEAEDSGADKPADDPNTVNIDAVFYML